MPHSSNPTPAAQGFALLEVAIVLVIIGLLLGGFLVGKDLVTNARAKSLATWVRGWEQSLYAHLDRKGGFPGDTNRNGMMGLPESETPRSSLETSSLQDVPPALEGFGSAQLTMLLGNSGGSSPTNVLAVVATESLGTAPFQQETITLLESLDTIVDGRVNPQTGLVRGYTSIRTNSTETVTALPAVAGSYANAVAVAYFFGGSSGSSAAYTNDFSDPNSPSYTIWDGSWDIANGELSSSNGYVTFGPQQADMTIEATMTLSDGSNGGAILYRVQDAGENNNKDFQGYGFQIDTPGGAIENEFVLRSFDKGSENILASVPYDSSTFSNYDTPHAVQIDVHGSTHTVSVDGTEVMRYEGTNEDDPGYTQPGQAGFRTWSGDVAFDDVTVQPR